MSEDRCPDCDGTGVAPPDPEETPADRYRRENDLLADPEGEGQETDELPADLRRILSDPSITIDKDRVKLADGRTLLDHIDEWMNAPSNTWSPPDHLMRPTQGGTEGEALSSNPPPSPNPEPSPERYVDAWPKMMFLCENCDEVTDSDPCAECAPKFRHTEGYPRVRHVTVVPESSLSSANAEIERLRGALTAIGSHAMMSDNDASMVWTARVALNPDALRLVPHRVRDAVAERFNKAESETKPSSASPASPTSPEQRDD